ncbi:MAG: 2-amino-4-hydroxy-6-hydroxymethyldihydropteridine diphosphokinase [Thiotrichales bacterium]|nr:2-amino-4-hydroxy-6-hydroxymethyldihydropteridine diphosphokinase [Thiotrichales bacterium]
MAQVYLSVGSNIDREKNILSGLDDLAERFGELECSPVYESVAFGFDGDNFYNLVLSFDTEESVYEVAKILRAIEDKRQRVRDGVKFSSRTLDLDLILYDDLVLADGRIRIPREDIEQYAFVLQPLADIAPDHIHPALGKTYTEMWAKFDPEQVKQDVVPFQWPL